MYLSTFHHSPTLSLPLCSCPAYAILTAQIFEGVETWGQKWHTIADSLEGRSANAVRNRFLRLVKMRTEENDQQEQRCDPPAQAQERDTPPTETKEDSECSNP